VDRTTCVGAGHAREKNMDPATNSALLVAMIAYDGIRLVRKTHPN
jgi:hypothetical protein